MTEQTKKDIDRAFKALEERDELLDKIRAEIEAIDTVKVKLDDYMNIIKSPGRIKDEVLEIIDKYTGRGE